MTSSEQSLEERTVKRSSIWSPELRFCLGFGCVFLILSAVFTMAYSNLSRAIEVELEVDHLYDTVLSSERVTSLREMAVSEALAYALTGEPEHKQKYLVHAADLSRELDLLAKLGSQKPAHSPIAQAVLGSSRRWLAELNSLMSENGRLDAAKMRALKNSASFMRPVRELQRGNYAELMSDRREAAQLRQETNITAVLVGTLTLMLFLALQILLFHHMKKRSQAEAALARLNASLEDEVKRRTSDLTVTVGRLEQVSSERERSRLQQSAVAELGLFALTSDDLDNLFALVVETTARVLGTEYCEILRFSGTTGELTVVCAFGWDEPLTGRSIAELDPLSEVAMALALAEPKIVSDHAQTARHPVISTLVDTAVSSTICVPFMEQRAPSGVLCAHTASPRQFSDTDANFLKAISNILRIAIERKAQQANAERLVVMEEREEFMATLSHDLKTPLIGSMLVLDSLLAGQAGLLNAEQRDLLEQLRKGTQSQLALIKTLVEVYRFDRAAFDMEFEEVELSGLIETCIDESRSFAGSKDITIETNFAHFLPRIVAHDLSVKRVVQNLLDNAIKVTPAGGRVCVMVSQSDSEVVIQVSDTGPGIPETELDQVFRRFWQSSRTKRSVQGTGLGLYLCKRIVDAHCGSITCLSTSGPGATFTVRLPIAQSRTAFCAV